MSKSAVSPFEKAAGVVAPTVLLGHKSMSTEATDDDSSDDEYGCPTCDRSFGSRRGLGIHHAAKHGLSLKEYEARESADATDCPTCGRTFANELGMRMHHGEVHNESLAGFEVKCSFCDAPKTVAHKKDEDDPHYFCDRKCYGKWQSENRVGENAATWNGGQVKVECAHCGGPKMVDPSHAAAHKNHFCGRGCMGAWQAENWVGEDAANWRGGISPASRYEHSWKKHREKALERDGYECVICGKSEDEIGRAPDVHHIVPLREFGSKRAGHQLGNLITLCPEHHRAAERRSITPMPTSSLTPQVLGD